MKATQPCPKCGGEIELKIYTCQIGYPDRRGECRTCDFKASARGFDFEPEPADIEAQAAYERRAAAEDARFQAEYAAWRCDKCERGHDECDCAERQSWAWAEEAAEENACENFWRAVDDCDILRDALRQAEARRLAKPDTVVGEPVSEIYVEDDGEYEPVIVFYGTERDEGDRVLIYVWKAPDGYRLSVAPSEMPTDNSPTDPDDEPEIVTWIKSFESLPGCYESAAEADAAAKAVEERAIEVGLEVTLRLSAAEVREQEWEAKGRKHWTEWAAKRKAAEAAKAAEAKAAKPVAVTPTPITIDPRYLPPGGDGSQMAEVVTGLSEDDEIPY